MKIKSTWMMVFLFFIVSLVVTAETPTQPILKAGDVEHFIKSFPALSKELKALGAQYDAHSGLMNYPAALRANNKLQELLKKHGWDEQFFTKTATICMGYSVAVYGKEYKRANPELEKSLQEIEANTSLSAELKKQMKDALMAAKAGLAESEKAMTKMINPQDLKLIAPFTQQLKTVLEKNN